MPWLVVLGSGSWQPAPGQRYPAGKHLVTDEVAALVRDSGLTHRLMVFAQEPEIDMEDGTGELTADDIKIGRAIGDVKLADDGTEVEVEQEEIEENILDLGAFKCQWCPEGFPNAAARGRHIWKTHTAEAKPPADVSSSE